MATATQGDAKQSDAQKAVGGFDGWQLTHEAEARSVKTGHGTFLVEEGSYIASKRVDTTVVDVIASSEEQLKQRIEEWERSHATAEPGKGPSEDQLLESAKATLSSLVTAGARPSVTVDLTPAGEKAEPKATELSVPPVIEETKLDDDDAALVATTPAPKGKTTGLGDGTTSGP